MTYLCPKGHQSSEADYCSECGLRIGAPPTASASPATSSGAGAGEDCPVCGAPRAPGARFCEVCRYDFVAKKPADAADDSALAPAPAAAVAQAAPTPAPAPPAAPDAAPSAAPAPAAPSVPAPLAASSVAIANPWAIVTVEKSLMGPEAAGLTFPEGEPQHSYPLDLDENLVGRRSARTNVHPEIPIGDPSVSSRHLKICRHKDGSLYLVDVGSSNGTKLNGVAVEPGVETSLKAGDQIVIGAWTKIAIEAR
jgi:hypothetical protein